VGAGYLNLQKDKAFQRTSTGERLYRTGDWVRFNGENLLEFLGRRDTQVKVRGFRVDLEHISQVIQKTLTCQDVVTVLRTTPEPHVVSFIQTQTPWKKGRVEEVLAQTLPGYMVPQQCLFVHAFPLTQNLKINRKFLSQEPLAFVMETYGQDGMPDIQEGHLPEGCAAPPESVGQGCVKAHLRQLLQQHFGITVRIQDETSPFGTFGLSSLSLNQFSAILNRTFSLSLKPHDFYLYNTFQALAAHVSHTSGQTTHVHHSLGHVSQVASSQVSFHVSSSHMGPLKKPAIAIVGASGALANTPNLSVFWETLLSGGGGIQRAHRPSLKADTQAGFMEDIAGFDPRFFEISPLEATHMDPQQRLLLMHGWAALEDAGYAPSSLEGKSVGVYTVASCFDYYLAHQRTQTKPVPYTLSGVSPALFAGRLSAFFNWNGPSLALDAACSGSLVAVIRAVQDLQEGRVEWALVGASNLLLEQAVFDALQAGNFLSPRFRCATFDQEADGYVRGEGVGCVLLRRLDDALCDRDPCHGVIVSTAENHGGRAHSLTAPNPQAQKNLLLQAYADRDLAARVSFIEAHGTGTKLGDPIEVDALKAAWNTLGVTSGPVYLGSVKTHIGHLEPAAGMASLLKVLLSFKHKTLPANLHFHTLNPYIDLGASPFRVLAETVAWDTASARTAGISSFGFGGSNAHVVVEQAPPLSQPPASPPNPVYLVVLSAKTPRSLKAARETLRRFVKDSIHGSASPPPGGGLASIAYTLCVGRDHFSWRLAVCASSLADLWEKLERAEATETQPKGVSGVAGVSSTPPLPPPHAADYPQALQDWRDAYLAGYTLDWSRLYPSPTPDRIHLPPYPFDTQPYWFEKAADSQLMRDVANA
jgi:3-oxoacyl-(acyl-carrier-protein) synthase/acyl carrier protein